MRTCRNGCDGCGSLEHVIHRTLEGTRDCTAAGCLLEEFIGTACGQIERHYANRFTFLRRIVTDPIDVAVIAAGDLLDGGGTLRIGEIRKFLAINEAESRIHHSILKDRWYRYVAVRLKTTMAAMHGEDDPWARKIRGSVEQAVWKSKDICRIPRMRKVLYYRPANGDPRLGGEEPEMEQIVSDLFQRKVPLDPVSAFLAAAFDFLSGHPSSCSALSITEMTRIVVIYQGMLYCGEIDELQDDALTSLDDDDRRMVDNAVRSLIDGRLGYYSRQGIYSEEECEAIVSMARGYLEHLLQWELLPLNCCVHAIFPKDEGRSRDPVELKRISNILMFARNHVKRNWHKK